MTNDTSPDRARTFRRWFNVRDLGGLPLADGNTTLRGRLYRAGVPGRLVDEDETLARTLGIRTTIDLRRDDEQRGVHPLVALGAAHRRANIQATPGGPGGDLEITPERYMLYLDGGRDAIRDVFTWLGDEATYPAVMHCAAGTHRTAVVVALGLDLLGVPHEAIEADYQMSVPESERLLEAWAARGWFADASPAQLQEVIAVHPGVIVGFLGAVAARYGGTEGYLRSIGVAPEALAGFRRAMTN